MSKFLDWLKKGFIFICAIGFIGAMVITVVWAMVWVLFCLGFVLHFIYENLPLPMPF